MYQLLVDSGADATVTNSNGQTPADIATNSDHNTIAKKLETHIVFSVITYCLHAQTL